MESQMSSVTLEASKLKPNGTDPVLPRWSDLCSTIKDALGERIRSFALVHDLTKKCSLHPVDLGGAVDADSYASASPANPRQLTVDYRDCVDLWSNNLLSFIALSAAADRKGSLYFKVIDNEKIQKPVLEPPKGKIRRNVVKAPTIPKDDNRLISAVAKASFIALDGDKKKSPNSPGKVAYKTKDGQWEIPKAYPKGIYSLGNIKEEKGLYMCMQRPMFGTATKALEHLKSLVEDFKIVKDSKHACIFDEDENNSDLDSSHMSRFFKSSQTSVPPPIHNANFNNNEANVMRENPGTSALSMFVNESTAISERVYRYNRALDVCYGTGDGKGDRRAAIPLFEALAQQPMDAITPLVYYELGKIWLYGYDGWVYRIRDIAKATKSFEAAASLSHAPSMLYLSFLYSFSPNAEDVDTSVKLLTKAAKLNNLPALLALGYRNLYGIDCIVDLDEAMSFYKQALKASANEYDSAVFTSPQDEVKISAKSIEAYKSNTQTSENQREQARRYWESKAREGDGFAKYEVAKHTLDHQEQNCTSSNEKQTTQSYLDEKNAQEQSRSIQLLKEAAEANVPAAMRDLGLAHLSGTGVEKDKLKGLSLLNKALEYGDVDSANYLGYIYYTGQYGIPPNDETAARYFKVGTRYEMAESFFFLGEIASKYAAQQGSKDLYKAAFNYYQSAADYGLVHAYQREAVMLVRGIGTPPNEHLATLNFKAIAEVGYGNDIALQTFTSLVDNDHDSAMLSSLLGAFVGIAACQYNAVALYSEHKSLNSLCSNMHTQIIKYASQCYAQGDFTVLKLLGDLATASKQVTRALYYYYKGFKHGDVDCIEPCIRLYATEPAEINKAIVLAGYNLSRIKRNNPEAQNWIGKNLKLMRAWLTTQQLQGKQFLFSLFNIQ